MDLPSFPWFAIATGLPTDEQGLRHCRRFRGTTSGGGAGLSTSSLADDGEPITNGYDVQPTFVH